MENKFTIQELDSFSDDYLRRRICTIDGIGKEKKEQMLDELLWRFVTDKERQINQKKLKSPQ